MRPNEQIRWLKKQGSLVLLIITWLAVFIAGFDLFRVAALVVRGPIVGDEGLFFAVAHGLRNGLHMWRDLFETKPPVVFWFAELSLHLTGGNLVYRGLLVSGLLVLPLLLGAVPFLRREPLPARVRWLHAGVAAFLGCSLSIYIAARSRGYYAEGFGAVPSTLAVLCFLNAQTSKRRWLSEGIAAVAFAFLLLLKEPFVVTLVLAWLLLVRSKADARSLVRVLLLGSAISFLVLAFTGLLADYVRIYMPEMLGGRVLSTLLYHDYRTNTFYTAHASSILRGLNVRRAWNEFFVNEPFPAVGVALILLLVSYPRACGRKPRPAAYAAGVGLSVLLLLASEQVFEMVQVVTLLGKVPLTSRFFQWKAAELIGLVAGSVLLTVFVCRRSRELIVRSVLVAVAVYTITLAAGIGNFEIKYFLFALPIWVALVATLFARATIDSYGQAVILGLFLVLGVNFPKAVVFTEQEFINQNAQMMHPIDNERSASIDAVLSACHVDRYMLADQAFSNLPALTQHSPFQIGYGVLRASPREVYRLPQAPNAYLQAKSLDDWRAAQVLVASLPSDWTPSVPDGGTEGFARQFTATPWRCAATLVPDAERIGLRFFFRKSQLVPSLTR